MLDFQLAALELLHLRVYFASDMLRLILEDVADAEANGSVLTADAGVGFGAAALMRVRVELIMLSTAD